MTKVFVFGSNLAGRHGAGSAWQAYREHGAAYWVGRGRTGRSYAIPTKDAGLQTLPLTEIAKYVQEFIEYAKEHPDIRFDVVKIGCGLAGYREEQIIPLFKGTPENCRLPELWRESLSKSEELEP